MDANEEEIQKVNQELQFLELSLVHVKDGMWDEGYLAVVFRILARTEQHLEQLKRGMR